MKNGNITLSRTLGGRAQTEKRLAAMAERRSRNSFRRFLESMGGEGFEFQSDGMRRVPQS